MKCPVLTSVQVMPDGWLSQVMVFTDWVCP